MNTHVRANQPAEPGTSSPALAVIVVTYNSAPVLTGLLDSLPGGLRGVDGYRAIIVDNNSSDASVELALAHTTEPEVIRMGRNAGYAAAINAAAELISADMDLLVLNPDIRLLPYAGRILRSSLGQSTGIAVPQILHVDGSVALSLRREPSILTAWSEAIFGGSFSTRIGTSEIIRDIGLYSNGGCVEWATGAALMISAQARERIGLWDESFFLFSEEVDYMRRCRNCELSVRYVSEAQVVHIGGEAKSDPFLSSLLTTNRIRDYSRRHGSMKTAIFRLGVAIGEAVRSPLGPVHRASLRAALSAPRS